MLWKEITSRDEGRLRPNSFSRRLRSRRISSLQLSNFKEFVSPHRGAINSLQVDLTEGRYLLSGASDASAAVFDVQRVSGFEDGGLVAKHKCLFVIDKQHQQGHKYAISSATWYPIDTGLFVTGSYDHHINVWDTNTTQVVMNFKMPGKVYKTAMSPIATSHMLIASGTEDVQVRLCDIASGAFSHTLSGHRDGVMAVEWSTSSEWVLMTGGCDGAIRYWDIRRAGCFLVLDQSKSQLGRRPPLLERSVADKAATSKATGQSSSAKNRGQQKKVSLGNDTKLFAVSRMPSQLKGGYSKQRRHPGMMSSQDHATAHYGAVTGLKATEDGMYLLSAGSDSRLRLWDIESGCNTLVNFETVRLQNSKGIQMAVAQDSSLVFVPCMTSVKAFDLWSGNTSLTFRAHYECVNCCWFNDQDQVEMIGRFLSGLHLNYVLMIWIIGPRKENFPLKMKIIGVIKRSFATKRLFIFPS
ncbi:WD repeat-containing protein ATCSA-1 isoform X2 [Beta vulgaris subsp. vulgaris]|uniref:WD repeat-containing protein ATCSA-1 isoform X2 n=1 Tax=Beta vulgaris subsp. vulgaris TaxID=3555 RepID=UPI00254778D1|nr:WD repeat-containing protein ATCSA-1 isoform X2 [Beta vulgaris subsp. vulgaris]